MPKVHLDFGHGGKDPGAIGNELQEKDIALSIGLKVGNILKRHNVDVTYSRTTDTFVGLTDRAIMANDNNADVFVSIHANSATNATGQGVETYYYPNSKEGKRLAQNIQDSIIKSELYTKDRGIKEGNFAVLRHTKMPSALVELGFISNAEDVNILTNEQKGLAITVAKGILDYLGIKYIEKKEEHWGEKIYQELVEKGIVFSEKKFDDNPTRAESFAMINKVTEWVEEKLKGVK